jgi:hypothetical protein
MATTLLCVAVVGCSQPEADDDPFGYERLKAELGDATPDGSGIAVHLVEGSVDITETVDGVETSVGTGFAPDVADVDFLDVNIDVTPSVFARHSSHATSVGRRLFGKANSMSPGIVDVHAFESMTWIVSVLNMGRARLPETKAARIANHSWVGNADHPELPARRSVEILRRLDWLIDSDEFIQVVGFNGDPDSPLLSGAWNAISVSHIDGAYAEHSPTVGWDDYPVGRTRPDLVVPERNPSSAAPRVASAVALLIDGAQATASAAGSEGAGFPSRAGAKFFNAERGEVIKAALMAGAARAVPQRADSGGIADYRASDRRTANGLDRRYGAGALDIYNSYRIVTAVEHDSNEDRSGADAVISASGFDFDPSFGGRGGSNSSASYRVSAAPRDRDLTVALVWNARVSSGQGLRFDRPAETYDLDLVLYELDADGEPLDIVASRSRIDNTEHITAQLAANRDYALRVETGSGQAPFEWDYALAWRLD